MINNIIEIAQISPSPRQLMIQKMGFYGFIHFGTNTYTEMEWGDGTADSKVFNPVNLDTDQWVSTMKSSGMKGIIITAKHHDGFCLWPSQYTEYSVKNSPWKDGLGDVVGELAESCKKYDMKLGIYLSPWDRHEACYGTEAYNTYFINQLTELLTQYGEVFTVWFDGACGEGPNGKRQVYDWDAYYKVIRELQPEACISIMGPDVRWCGNEAGRCRESEWSVVPKEMQNQSDIAENSQKGDIGCLLENIGKCDEDLGSRKIVASFKEFVWYPSEVDTSIRPRWFYHQGDDDKVRSVEDLVNLYCMAVGGNNTLLLNVPPTKEGLIHDIDVKHLKGMGNALEEMFKEDITQGYKWQSISSPSETSVLNDGCDETYWTGGSEDYKELLLFDMKENQEIKMVLIQEYIEHGQRIESFNIEVSENQSQWKRVYNGTTIGYKKICLLSDVKARFIRISITSSRYYPELRCIAIF
ncbi:alpha-L-fucosidase [Vallitalea okinawensis]|uniref:alpha-L-fucosidase n=1 Tax=Vallitalea okinawensis TaxID=2078660 RepID=UPI000CFDAC64|nr:alpha-L-fucosidase [Vallitalea okinawensis]